MVSSVSDKKGPHKKLQQQSPPKNDVKKANSSLYIESSIDASELKKSENSPKNSSQYFVPAKESHIPKKMKIQQFNSHSILRMDTKKAKSEFKAFLSLDVRTNVKKMKLTIFFFF